MIYSDITLDFPVVSFLYSVHCPRSSSWLVNPMSLGSQEERLAIESGCGCENKEGVRERCAFPQAARQLYSGDSHMKGL